MQSNFRDGYDWGETSPRMPGDEANINGFLSLLGASTGLRARHPEIRSIKTTW